MVPSADHLNALYNRISEALIKSGDLTPEILDFIDASLFAPEPRQLAAFLDDEDNCERDTLLDLIFYPDQAVQIGLEPLLEENRYSAADENEIYSRMINSRIDVPIRMPDKTPVACIRVPDDIKTQYLVRLRISWRLDPGLKTAIDGSISASLQGVVKVRLRNAGRQFSSGQTTFLIRFFERMDDNSPDYPACLDLMLTLLDEKNPSADIYSLLVDYKRGCFRGLQQTRRFETMLRRSNMETLMLQGVRAPQESAGELLHRMGLIDRICFSIFGRTETMDFPMEERLQPVADLDDPEAAFRSLLR
jgi:hypothetical protein